jgi:hypothetical protein
MARLEIKKATYGGKDVTSIVKSKIHNDQLTLYVGNQTFGDPAPGTFKKLVLNINGTVRSFNENTYLSLPETNKKKLGIWYSNNNVDKTVRESVLNLQRFKDVADILTCVWRPIPGNPFYQGIAMTQSSNHLNIIIQILQLLYTGRELGNYEYVSFLEHDVLYPDGYFDFPDFEGGVLTNMNYIGICNEGFQVKTANHEPLHQMTMRFTDAIQHFENLMKEAIRMGGVLVEPDVKRKQWNCDNPAIHINHGKHFTSHFSIYSKETTDHNPYWGDAKSLIEKVL